MLEIRGLSKSYGAVRALREVDLEVRPGEIVGLLGPNGAGKTTLVTIVAGLRHADAGSVTVRGIDALRHPREARRLTGLAPQDIGIYQVLTTRQNLRFFGELAGLAGGALHDRVEETAAMLGLSELLERPAHTLSGGERRRLHTAMALLGRPPLLLLDEPTASADVQTRADLLTVVRRLAEDGAAVVYSTHYLHEVEALGATVAILERGELIARGSLQELIGAHGSGSVRLTFDGPAPSVALPGAVVAEGSELRIATDRPSEAAAAAMTALGEASARLVAVEIVRPSLESVYLALTGRRTADVADEEPDREAASVP